MPDGNSFREITGLGGDIGFAAARRHRTLAAVRVRFDFRFGDFGQLVRAADIGAVNPDLRHGDRRFRSDDRLYPGQHFVERPRLAHHIVIFVWDIRGHHIALGAFAVGAGFLAVDMRAFDLRPFGVGGR